jgi:DNA-directed RNA polymerase specialized sigma24 family protein
MIKKKQRVVKWQRLGKSEKTCKPCGEGSPYWDFVRQHGKGTDENWLVEKAIANPDVLPEGEEDLDEERAATARKRLRNQVMYEVLNGLTDEQKKIVELRWQCTEEETAYILGVSRSTVQVVIRRITEKAGSMYDKRLTKRLLKNKCHQ